MLDSSYATLLAEVLPGLNCLAERHTKRHLATAPTYDPADTAAILVVMGRPIGGPLSSVAYSSLEGNYILLIPEAIKQFTQANALTDSTSYDDVLSLVLLHELGHFALGIEGAFDSMEPSEGQLGEQRRASEPEYMNAAKLTELKVDSIAMSWVSAMTTYERTECSSACMGVMVILPGMSFQLFSNGLLSHFGSLQPRVLRDPSPTHPNLELRIAFMNYYLNPDSQAKQIVDDYMYNREVMPIHLQEFDPAIYDGFRKLLPDDTAYVRGD